MNANEIRFRRECAGYYSALIGEGVYVLDHQENRFCNRWRVGRTPRDGSLDGRKHEWAFTLKEAQRIALRMARECGDIKDEGEAL